MPTLLQSYQQQKKPEATHQACPPKGQTLPMFQVSSEVFPETSSQGPWEEIWEEGILLCYGKKTGWTINVNKSLAERQPDKNLKYYKIL